MPLTRRQLLAAIATGAAGTVCAAPQSRGGGAAKVRPTPAICLYSRILAGKVDHIDLPMVVRGLGFDGCDLSVEPGGHVLPEKAGLFLMPALEALTGAGLDVPVISTALTSAQDKTAEEVLGLATYIGVPLFRPGRWAVTGSAVSETRLPVVLREIAGLGGLGRAVNMAMAVQNFGGSSESASVADLMRVIRPFDPRWIGFDFDPGFAAVEGRPTDVETPLEMALPRLKMVSLRDFKWAPDAEGGNARKMTPCPLGEGVVDWPRFFTALARARFTGPLSLQVDYQPKDALAAIRRDLDFVRKQVAAAYAGQAPSPVKAQ